MMGECEYGYKIDAIAETIDSYLDDAAGFCIKRIAVPTALLEDVLVCLNEYETLKQAIEDAIHECWDTPKAERILRDALLAKEQG